MNELIITLEEWEKHGTNWGIEDWLCNFEEGQDMEIAKAAYALCENRFPHCRRVLAEYIESGGVI